MTEQPEIVVGVNEPDVAMRIGVKIGAALDQLSTKHQTTLGFALVLWGPSGDPHIVSSCEGVPLLMVLRDALAHVLQAIEAIERRGFQLEPGREAPL